MLKQVINAIKRMDYAYDLISGSVKQVSYQAGFADQFFHHYYYDSQIRLTRATTSKDGSLWQEDARYYYYAHGPLARVELGHHLVQGTDYAYTLQGWLKGVNSDKLAALNDIGKDGHNSNARNITSTTDAYGYSLNYYDAGTGSTDDYKPRGTLGGIGNAQYPFASFTASGSNSLQNYDLFNGNISRVSTTIYAGESGQPGHIAKLPQLMSYNYDQLNRIYSASSASGYNSSSNTWVAEDDQKYDTQYGYDGNGNITTLSRNGHLSGDYEMDNLVYDYTPGTNQLRLFLEGEEQYSYDNDLDYFTTYDTYYPNTSALYDDLYEYDNIGNLVKDHREKMDIQWYVNGKVKAIKRGGFNVADLPDLEFAYDAMGNRVSKLIKSRTGNEIDDKDEFVKTYYVRDAQGNIMATYERIWNGPEPLGSNSYTQSDQLTLREQAIYGSSRVGLKTPNREIARRYLQANSIGGDVSFTYAPNVETTGINPFVSTYLLGKRKYELSNHLGNVLSVVSDNIWVNGTGGNTLGSFSPDILAANDYYAFGAIMPGRSFNTDSYRFGFNGQEKDDEVKGSGNSYDFGARMHDPRLGRFLSIDPLSTSLPAHSPYSYSINNPIMFVDEEGEWPGVTYMFFEIEAGAGFFLNGVSYIRQSGVARDEVGKTHFIMAYAGTFSHDDTFTDNVIYGAGASASFGIQQSWDAETFVGDQSGWTTGTASVGAAAGPGATASFGVNRVGFQIGVGLEAKAQFRSTYVLESISLADNEAEEVNDRSSGNTSWGLSNRTTKKDENGRFWADVTIDVGSDQKTTDVRVFSRDGNIWQSENYQQQAEAAEKED
jgi:RHS repeat-associated protein